MSYKRREIQPDFPIHITARCNNREHFPNSLDYTWDLFSDYFTFIHHNFGIKFHSLVLMPNHFHSIVRDPQMKLSEGMNYFMRETSKIMGRDSKRMNKIWGGPFHSSTIASPHYYLHGYKYVYRNPTQAMLGSPLNWKFSTLPQLLGQHRGIIPLEYDATLFEDVEGTLAWLNQQPKAEHYEAVKNALKKRDFTLRKDRKTQKDHVLEFDLL